MQAIAVQLQNARMQLAPVAGEMAALEARVLAAHAWGMSPEALVLCGNEARDADVFAALVARRLAAEPVAQILGTKDFWKDTFRVTRDVLTPRADSETIIETLLRLRPDTSAPLRILDLGTGSGCLLLSALREYVQATGVGADRSEAALAIAVHNATALGLENRCELLHSDWCSTIAGSFDVIISNPPYIPTPDIAALDADVRDHEPHGALDGGADGLDCYRSIVQQLSSAPDCSTEQSCASLRGHTKPGSLVLFEVGAGQAEDVAALGNAAGWDFVEFGYDLAGIARVVALEIR